MLDEKIKKEINRFDYVSFDIFDTLIKRNLYKPTSLFKIVERKYEMLYSKKLDNWTSTRITAEKDARKMKKNEEITIDEIYDNINKHNLDSEKLKEIEINTEIELCERNKQFCDIYEYCKKQKKHIVIISDMYLDKNTIKNILEKNNITYDELFLSSDILKTKRTGSIYKYALKKLNINNSEIIHFGDNKVSDYEIPKKLKIKSILVKEPRNVLHYNKKDLRVQDEFDYKCLISFINNNIREEKSYYWKCGYEIFGPLLYGYVDWLAKKFKENNYDKIYFLSRDGFIMKRAFDIIQPNNKSQYFYASRRSLLVPTIWMCSNFKEILNRIHLPKEITVEALLKKLGLEPNKYKDVIEKYNYSLNQKINIRQYIDKEIEFFSLIRDDMISNSKEEYKSLLNYLNKMDFRGNVAIVDIGWYGNMQQALEDIIKLSDRTAKISGYYVGIVPESKKQEINIMNGYLFNKDKQNLFLKEKFFNSIFELFFSAHHGSVKKYTDKQGFVELYKYEYDGSETNKYINEFQNGAIEFIKDYSNSRLSKYIRLNEYIVTYNIFEFGNRPKKIDIESFGNIMFYDDDFYMILDNKSLLYYIFHPKRFLHDFDLSRWKTGFLKNIFKLNLPYLKLIIKIRERLKK